MAVDAFTRAFIERQQQGTHQGLLNDAERIASALNAYVATLRAHGPGSERTFSGEATRIATHMLHHAHDGAHYDGARDMSKTLLKEPE